MVRNTCDSLVARATRPSSCSILQRLASFEVPQPRPVLVESSQENIIREVSRIHGYIVTDCCEWARKENGAVMRTRPSYWRLLVGLPCIYLTPVV